MNSDSQVKILDGNTFVVSDRRGDIDATPTDTTGLFSFDTRFLSRWVLTVDGERLNPLSVDDMHYYESRFFLVPDKGLDAVFAFRVDPASGKLLPGRPPSVATRRGAGPRHAGFHPTAPCSPLGCGASSRWRQDWA